ncbi:MAG: SDR family oxidoreductase [Thermoleophilia bacterium]
MGIPEELTRSVLITGAARGIGRATAEAFAQAGWNVVAGVRDPAQLVPFESDGIRVVALDVTDRDSVRAGVGQASTLAGGPLTCVVNNAGWAPFGAVEDIDLDVARRAFETNLFGAVAVLQAAMPAMRERGHGVLVSVSTLSGRIPLPLFGMYSATKLSLAAVSEALALEVAPFGLRVVLIEAGVVDTEFARSTVISGSAGEPSSVYAGTRDRVLGELRGIRQRAPVRAEDVARTIVEAVENDGAPFRHVLPDDGLRSLTQEVGGPSPHAHELVRRFLKLESAE